MHSSIPKVFSLSWQKDSSIALASSFSVHDMSSDDSFRLSSQLQWLPCFHTSSFVQFLVFLAEHHSQCHLLFLTWACWLYNGWHSVCLPLCHSPACFQQPKCPALCSLTHLPLHIFAHVSVLNLSLLLGISISSWCCLVFVATHDMYFSKPFPLFLACFNCISRKQM